MIVGTSEEVTLALVPSISQMRVSREQSLHDALPLLRAQLQCPPLKWQPRPQPVQTVGTVCGFCSQGKPSTLLIVAVGAYTHLLILHYFAECREVISKTA